MTTIPYQFNLPAYAQDMLCWADGEPAKTKGELILPELPSLLSLCWGTAQGSPLRVWQVPYAPPLHWNGNIAVHGHLDSLHFTDDWAIFDLTGRLLAPDWKMQPTLNDLKQASYSSRISIELADEQFWYSFVTPLDSSFLDLLQPALLNGHALECYGSLASQKSNLHSLMGLPLVLTGLSLHASA